MRASDFFNSATIQSAATNFVEKYGGHFGIDEPGANLVYSDSEGEKVYTPPSNANEDDILALLNDSTTENLILTKWIEVVYDPNIDY